MWRRNRGHSMVHATSGRVLAELLFVDSVTADSQAGQARTGSLAALGRALAHAQLEDRLAAVGAVQGKLVRLTCRSHLHISAYLPVWKRHVRRSFCLRHLP